MTEDEAWTSGRGVWKVNAERARRQRFLLVVGEGVVRAVAEITGITAHTTPSGERTAFEGQVLPAGHPMRDRYLDQPDPVTNGSQNPVGYCDLDGELDLLARPCACECGGMSDRDFLPGHDVRAIQQRVREQFGGSPLALIRHLDASAATTDQPAGQPTITLAGFLAQVTADQQRHEADGPVDVYFHHDTLTPHTVRTVWDDVPRATVPAEGKVLTMRGSGYQGADAHWQVISLQWLDGPAVIVHVTDAPAAATATA
ncbi:hypothetical protein ABZ671_17155 [Micromonospora sp. NPDC006766]|uniref:hypothetical protein n=1 Tax=Micromonospora sp. NPDC006766 TaxID=3154778 RepID=UPI0033F29DA8